MGRCCSRSLSVLLVQLDRVLLAAEVDIDCINVASRSIYMVKGQRKKPNGTLQAASDNERYVEDD